MPKAGGADTNLHSEQQLRLCLTRRGVPVRAGAHGPELASRAARSTVGGQAPTLTAAGVAQGAEAIPAGRHACTQGAQQSESCSSHVLRSLLGWPQQSEAAHAERPARMQGRQPKTCNTTCQECARVAQGIKIVLIERDYKQSPWNVQGSTPGCAGMCTVPPT